MYHCFGCVAGSLSGVLFGATCVLPSPGFDPKAVVQSIEKEKYSLTYFS